MGPIEFLCDLRFHRTITLPANPSRKPIKPLRISYSDFGDTTSNAVVLFCGALMGTRFCYSHLDQLAKEKGVRIIQPDRPGIGGSDAVELHDRIPVWLELIPPLLSHLDIPTITLASHSGGLLYALNTLLTHPHLLHPTNPYIAFFAPWVHPAHSGVSTLHTAHLLPSHVIHKFASLARFINSHVVPVAGLTHAYFERLKWCGSAGVPVALVPNAPADGEAGIEFEPGDQGFAVDLRALVMRYMFAEDVDGMGCDAQIFLKRPHSVPWSEPQGLWADVDSFVRVLVRRRSVDPERAVLTVDCFHAEVDQMVGVRGREWFDECWEVGSSGARLEEKGEEEMRDERLLFRSEIVEGSDHNYLLDAELGASVKWLERVRESFTVPDEEEDNIEMPPEPEARPFPFEILKDKAKKLMKAFSWKSTPQADLDSLDEESSTRTIYKGKLGKQPLRGLFGY